MNKLVDYIKWNNVLAFFISIGAALTMFMLKTEGLGLFETIWMTLALSGIVFGLFGRFYSNLGALIKVSAILSIGIFLLYMTRDTKDEQILMIVRVVVIFMTLTAIIAHLVFFYLKNRRLQLVENGWLVKTVVISVLHESAMKVFKIHD